jgi:hypothetical protein
METTSIHANASGKGLEDTDRIRDTDRDTGQNTQTHTHRHGSGMDTDPELRLVGHYVGEDSAAEENHMLSARRVFDAQLEPLAFLRLFAPQHVLRVQFPHFVFQT